MSLICLDTQILIWGIKEEAEQDQEEFISKSKILIEHLQDNGDKILIPSIILSEFILHLPQESHTTVVNLLTANFFVAPYDQLTALHYARIWQNQEHQNRVREIHELGTTRNEIKADRMIVATAVAHNAERIYSHDKGLRNFAEGFCDAYDIPTIPIQTTWLDD